MSRKRRSLLWAFAKRRMKVSEEKTPSQASQEAADPLEILKDAEDTARVARNHCHLQPSYWSANCFKEIRERISEARTLLSHPPKGGAKPAPIKDEDYPHSLDDCIQRMEFLAIEGIADGSRPRIGGLCLSVAEHLGRLKSLEEGVRGPVARGGLPGAARQSCPRCSSSLIRNGERLDCINHGCGFWVHLPETPQASGEASEPATSPKTGCNLCDTHGLGACQVPHLYQAPESPKPSQGREWTLMVENETDHIACGWKETPKGIHSQPMSGCRYVRVREVVEPQERGS
jgi:hypothetical protein